jgi:hypothetical protein
MTANDLGYLPPNLAPRSAIWVPLPSPEMVTEKFSGLVLGVLFF